MNSPAALEFRLSQMQDAPLLTQWLLDPEIMQWFPMSDAREVEDAVRIWLGYSKIEAGLTALCDQRPCALANLYIQPYVKQRHTCLFSIIVSKDMRGKGIGRALLEHLERHAKAKFQIEILHLEVYEGNPAQKLYEKMGFIPFGRQERFTKEQGRYRAKILMQKRL